MNPWTTGDVEIFDWVPNSLLAMLAWPLVRFILLSCSKVSLKSHVWSVPGKCTLWLGFVFNLAKAARLRRREACLWTRILSTSKILTRQNTSSRALKMSLTSQMFRLPRLGAVVKYRGLPPKRVRRSAAQLPKSTTGSKSPAGTEGVEW